MGTSIVCWKTRKKASVVEGSKARVGGGIGVVSQGWAFCLQDRAKYLDYSESPGKWLKGFELDK